MTTLADFIAEHNGRYLDYDGRYGAQCVDLIDYYCQDVLGIPIVWADAIGWFGKDNLFLEWVRNDYNDTTQFPQPGDIVVWGQNHIVGTGVVGHIDICISATGTNFIGFDQNWPPGSPCHVVNHAYDGVIGWGRYYYGGKQMGNWQSEQVGSDNAKAKSVTDLTEVTDKDGNKSVHLVCVGLDDKLYHFWTAV